MSASHTLWLAVLACLPAMGCTHLSYFTQAMWIHADAHHELADIRHDTRQALAKERAEALRLESQREIEAARFEAQQQIIAAELCQSNREALRKQVQNQIQEQMQSKVAFNVQQGLEVGEIEVDVEALQNILKEREAQTQPPAGPPEALTKPPCKCCDKQCGCRPGLLRKHCPHCCNKCDCEKDCGGEEALKRLAQEPLRKPLRPAEIPLRVPLRLTFGMEQPQIEAQRVIKTYPGQEAVKKPCDYPHCEDKPSMSPMMGQPPHPVPEAVITD